ncbi:MAG TPA: transporter [Chitinivibrionales bacterium]|nr:transporter [Chitinivibrionales bacterium]
MKPCKIVFYGAILAAVFAASQKSFAGPPFVTDDPEPVDFLHWEVYVGSQIEENAYGIQGTLPHVEVNFGAFPGGQLHIIAPYLIVNPSGGGLRNGIGDIELGVKYRFIKEYPWFPQVGTFPHLLVPTGDTARGTGTGRYQIFVPLWLQKSFGAFTTYGGGGMWFSPSYSQFNYWSLGWEAQYDITKMFTLGAELFHNTKAVNANQAETGLNGGGIVNVNAAHHILISAGTDIDGPNRLMVYAAYQLTI